MNALYLDIFSGISGDMFLGAMIDLGVEVNVINDALSKTDIKGVKLVSRRKVTNGINSVKIEVIGASEDNGEDFKFNLHQPAGYSEHYRHSTNKHTHNHGEFHHDDNEKESAGDHFNESHPPHVEHRNFESIQTLIRQSGLTDWVKERSINIFERIARVEAKIHGCRIEEVHFHEVGAIDSIVDIIGACVALEFLGKPRVFSSDVVDGSGFVRCAHGNYPLPAPATLEILAERNIKISQCNEPGELVTPTGAAILAEFVEKFGLMENFKPIKIGYGTGTRQGKTRPNLLRAILCEIQDTNFSPHDWDTDKVAVIETNLDDINSEVLGNFIEKAFSTGALDVYYSQVLMKKNRPGVVLHLICDLSRVEEFAKLILMETTAFGVRVREYSRFKLKRKFNTVSTEYGEIKIKEGYLDGVKIQASPEFEDCKLAARKHNVPLRTVYEAALKEYMKSLR